MILFYTGKFGQVYGLKNCFNIFFTYPDLVSIIFMLYFVPVYLHFRIGKIYTEEARDRLFDPLATLRLWKRCQILSGNSAGKYKSNIMKNTRFRSYRSGTGEFYFQICQCMIME